MIKYFTLFTAKITSKAEEKAIDLSHIPLHHLFVVCLAHLYYAVTNFGQYFYLHLPLCTLFVTKAENAYHCCGLFLRAIWDGGIKYNPLLVHGWEDWDFWLNIHTAIGANTLIVKKPLYNYHSWGSSKGHMASYCTKHRPLCEAMFHFANYDKYDEGILAKDVEALVKKSGKGVLQLTDHSGWKHIENLVVRENRIAQLLLILAKLYGYKANKISSSVTHFEDLKATYCEDKKFLVLVNLVIKASVGAKVNLKQKEAKCVDSFVSDNNAPQEESILGCKQLDDLLFSRLVKSGGRPGVFHIIVSAYPTDWTWVKMLHHTIVGVMSFNRDAIVVIHSPLPTIATIFHDGFLKALFPRLRLATMCADRFSSIAGMEQVHDFMKRKAQGRPFYYSHFTDFYRLLLLYNYGGTYLDADIVLRTDVSNLQNVLPREDKKYLNGAYLSFDAHHPFLKHCLEAIPGLYDPYIWGIIGPVLLTKVYEHFRRKNDPPLVLPVDALYSVNWNHVSNLINGVDLKREEYDKLGGQRPKSQIGYHFWSKMLFKENFVIEQNSPGGWALSDSCLCNYMGCLLKPTGECRANAALGLGEGGAH